MAGASTQSLRDTYVLKSEELCCAPIPSLLRDMDLEISAGRTLRALQLGGNAPERFDARIDSMQLLALCEALCDDTSVEFLDLSYNDATPGTRHGDASAATFGNAGAAAVARLLRVNTALKFVILEGNAIQSDGAAALAAVLGKGGGNSTVEMLNLATNSISDKGAVALAGMLEGNTALRMLDVGGCDIGVTGVLALSAALAQHNKTLETLGLDDCLLRSPVQADSSRHLSSMLASNTSLKQLYLSKQGLRDCNLEVIIDYGLVSNRSIEVLDLRANSLSPMCAPNLARLLHENASIQVLNLSCNRLSDEGAVAIAEALPFNRTLQELDLQSCSINDTGLVVLARALALCASVNKVSVAGNGFGCGAAAAWRDLMLQASADERDLVVDIEPYEVDGVPTVALVR